MNVRYFIFFLSDSINTLSIFKKCGDVSYNKGNVMLSIPKLSIEILKFSVETFCKKKLRIFFSDFFLLPSKSNAILSNGIPSLIKMFLKSSKLKLFVSIITLLMLIKRTIFRKKSNFLKSFIIFRISNFSIS